MKNKPEYNVKIYSYLFIFLGIWDIVLLALDFFNGKLNAKTIATSANVSTTLVSNVLIGIIIIVVIFALLKAWIGYKGFKIAEKKSSSNSLIKVLKFIFVIEIISLIILVTSIFQKNANYTEILSTLANVLIIWDYIRNIKLIKKDEA